MATVQPGRLQARCPAGAALLVVCWLASLRDPTLNEGFGPSCTPTCTFPSGPPLLAPSIPCTCPTHALTWPQLLQPGGVPGSFGNDEEAFAALESGAVLVDRTNAGRLRVGGEDRLAFLHGQSTNDLQALQPGQGCDTVGVGCDMELRMPPPAGGATRGY